MSRPRILLYLHHIEVGQRYPVSEDIIIGRKTGHILFPKDERLSDEHCRIYQTPNGLHIRDVGSKNGTVVDGRLLSPEKSYPLRDGTMISVGAQVFKCVEPSNRPFKKQFKKKKKKQNAGLDFSGLFFSILLFAAGFGAWKYQKTLLPALKNLWAQVSPPAEPNSAPVAPIPSPFEMVYKETQIAYDRYRDVGKEVQDGRLAGKALASDLRNDLIPKFQAAQTKLGVLKPSNEAERRRIEANARLVTAILNQMKAMAKFGETGDQKFSTEVDKFTPEVEAASTEARKWNERRVPAASN